MTAFHLAKYCSLICQAQVKIMMKSNRKSAIIDWDIDIYNHKWCVIKYTVTNDLIWIVMPNPYFCVTTGILAVIAL